LTIQSTSHDVIYYFCDVSENNLKFFAAFFGTKSFLMYNAKELGVLLLYKELHETRCCPHHRRCSITSNYLFWADASWNV